MPCPHLLKFFQKNHHRSHVWCMLSRWQLWGVSAMVAGLLGIAPVSAEPARSDDAAVNPDMSSRYRILQQREHFTCRLKTVEFVSRRGAIFMRLQIDNPNRRIQHCTPPGKDIPLVYDRGDFTHREGMLSRHLFLVGGVRVEPELGSPWRKVRLQLYFSYFQYTNTYTLELEGEIASVLHRHLRTRPVLPANITEVSEPRLNTSKFQGYRGLLWGMQRPQLEPVLNHICDTYLAETEVIVADGCYRIAGIKRSLLLHLDEDTAGLAAVAVRMGSFSPDFFQSIDDTLSGKYGFTAGFGREEVDHLERYAGRELYRIYGEGTVTLVLHSEGVHSQMSVVYRNLHRAQAFLADQIRPRVSPNDL